ncbi:PLP-dependent aminotransferase family protein [Leptospira ilyithenensis]|uniref:PLP-dependent aminotransferase family protein n=1 Tax=Leptospira ilyithenensis TaxID=2484901 RepID=A0A4R9LP36_9LEPT|nr:PLP-dependent aminotransferase family protein [Leptospira ilyithenensis]TGN09147.1 PLP-dependent aminotransferase family protein [Leptospira ilyithenensis]
MNHIFSDRISDVPKSFLREILKTTVNEDVISFAGGLPNRDLFPIGEIKKASVKVLDEFGGDALQYSNSEGYLELRKWISDRYALKMGILVNPDNILITTGSQQGLDLIGKTLINESEYVAIEEPGYLGAIQAFSLYRPRFLPIPLHFDGLDLKTLQSTFQSYAVKLIYGVPNFQNPSGLSHSDENRDEVAKIISNSNTILVEDDPYGELQFQGEKRRSYFSRIPEQTVLLGSFSKIFAPSLRIGWMVAPDRLMEKLIIAKQASDLHTNYFGQRILHQYLTDNDLDLHITKIKEKYSKQKEAMISAIGKYFPKEIKYSNPNGGMFLWVILPEQLSSRVVFDLAIKEKVAFVPGDPFYINRTNANTMRLNFSCVDEETIETGIRRLGKIISDFIS